MSFEILLSDYTSHLRGPSLSNLATQVSLDTKLHDKLSMGSPKFPGRKLSNLVGPNLGKEF